MGFSNALGITRSTSVSVDLVSSCLAVVPLGQGDYLLPLADVSLPFGHCALPSERYAFPSVDYATLCSSYGAREQRHLQLPLLLRLLCRYAFWPDFLRWFACCCPECRSCACSRLLHHCLPPLPYYLFLLPEDYVRLRSRICFHRFQLPLQFRVLFRLARRLRPGD